MALHIDSASSAPNVFPTKSTAARRRSAIRSGILAGLIGAAATLTSPAFAGESVIVGYYHSNTLVNYDATNTSTVNYTTPGVTPEGVGWIMGGPGSLGNALLIGNPTSGYVELVNATNGTVINSQYMTAPDGGKFDGLAGMALSSNGQDLYITQSGGSNTGIYEYNTVTGKEVGFTSFTDAHDVTFHDGYLYATGYENTNSGVWRFNADLTGATQIISGGDHGLSNATGMSFNGNNLYVGNVGINVGNAAGSSFVSEYTLSGSSATYDQKFSNPTSGATTNYLLNPFGVTYNDGSIYVSALGDLGNDHGQVTAINASTGALSDYIPYTSADTVAPKYVSFESQCVMYTVPEPGTMLLMVIGTAGIGVQTYVRRRRTPA
jgi:hypothetical protein